MKGGRISITSTFQLLTKFFFVKEEEYFGISVEA
jgi:hypothetical protein